MCKFHNLAVHWQLHHYTTHHYTTGHFIPNKYLSQVFYENRDLKISKSKKSEQYFPDKIDFFLSVSSMNTLLAILKGTDARRDVILAGGLYPQISLETPPLPPGSDGCQRHR